MDRRLDDELLDALAECFVAAAVDTLMHEQEEREADEELAAAEERGAPHALKENHADGTTPKTDAAPPLRSRL